MGLVQIHFKHLILFFSIILFIFIVSALEINEFSDETISKNLTFEQRESKYVNVSLPNEVNITNASLILRGFIIINRTDQENANKTFADGNWQSGGGNTYDGNYNSFDFISAGTAFLWVNYSTPAVTNSSDTVWRVVGQDIDGDLDIPAECWSDTKIQLSVAVDTSWKTEYRCFNGVDNTVLHTVSGGSSTYTILYEERMRWSTKYIYPTNITIKTDNDMAYQNLSVFNGSKYGNVIIDLNKSALQGCIDSCSNPSGNNCLCEINFTSTTAGKLQISNLNITYHSSPNATNITITPSPADTNENLTCGYDYFDIDGDVEIANFTRWYINNSLTGNTSEILAFNFTSEEDKIICSKQVQDGYRVGSWFNSSIFVVGDSTPPILFGNYTSPASVERDSTIDTYINVTDILSNISWVKIEIENPNTIKTNFSMNIDVGNRYKYVFTTSIVGTHKVRFYARDTSGNEKNTTQNLTFLVTAPIVPPSPPGGGGGGGGLTIFTPTEGTPNLFFGLTTISFLVVTTPTVTEKIVKFKNIGNATFEGDVFIDGRASELVTINVCDIDLENCKNEEVEILVGESKLLVLNGEFPLDLGGGSDGIIKFITDKSTLGTSTQQKPTFEINLEVTRYPLYRAVSFLSRILNIAEIYAVLLLFFISLSLIFAIFYSGIVGG